MALDSFKLENLPRIYQVLLIAALTVGLGAAGYTFFVKDLVAQRTKLKTEIAGLETAVAQAAAVESRLAEFKRELAELDAHLAELCRILPSEKETPEVLRAVQQMASQSNLKITKFAPQTVALRDFYSDWPITMEVQGSYNALGGFFEKIGQFRRIVNVVNISIKNIEGSVDPLRTLTSTCTATTFVYHGDQGYAPDK